MPRALTAVALALLASAPLPAAPPIEAALKDLASFSAFEKADVRRLADGEVLADDQTAMGDPRDISVESCFLVRAPADAAAAALPAWDPSRHPELDVLMHRPVRSPPQEADFEALQLDASKPFVRWLVAKTLAAAPGKGDLQLTAEDAQAIASRLGPSGAEAAVAPLWRGLLLARAAAFERGGLAGLPPYRRGGETIAPLGEIARLLKQDAAVSARFDALLHATCLSAGPSSAETTGQAYWELSKVSDHATLGLGKVYVRRAGEGFQAADCQHYATGGLYASLVLWQLWPVSVEGREMTLAWRGDFVSSASLAATRGTERMACGAIMAREVKKAARFFREDLEKAAR
jgi:hypothetical protein